MSIDIQTPLTEAEAKTIRLTRFGSEVTINGVPFEVVLTDGRPHAFVNCTQGGAIHRMVNRALGNRPRYVDGDFHQPGLMGRLTRAVAWLRRVEPAC